MISSSLFRPLDVVHCRDDLNSDAHYPMIYDPTYDCRVGGLTAEYKGQSVIIAGVEQVGRYRIDMYIGWCDTVFREGARIARFLKTEGGIAF